MTFYLFTTTDVRSTRGADFERLLASVDASGERDVRHYILLQNASETDLARVRASAPSWCRVTTIPGRLSISDARNRLLAEMLAEHTPGDADIVGFPDDDCWLPQGFLQGLARAFDDNESLDVFFCRVSPDPEHWSAESLAISPARTREVVRVANSNSLYVRGGLVAQIGPFDPALGLGTPRKGGEDTDYAIRAFLAGRESTFIDRPLVGHPLPDRRSAAKYFWGAMVVLARHARARPALRREFLRKIAVGVYFVARGWLQPGTYGRALTEAMSTLSAARAGVASTS